MPYIILNNTAINRSKEVIDRFILVSCVVDSPVSPEEPKFITSIEELDLYFEKDFTDYEYFVELIRKNVGLLLYKPVTPELIDSEVFYDYENYKKGYMATSTCFGVSLSSNVFTKGQCIMTVYSNAGARYHMPLDGSFELGIAPCPQKNINDPCAYQYGTDVSLFQCDDPQEELAGWLFLKWLTNYESAMIWVTGYDEYTNIDGQFVESAKGTAYFPIRKDVLNSEKYKEYVSGKEEATDGSVVYNPTAQNLAAQVGLEQQDWFFTNVAFDGSSAARDRVGALVKGLLTEDHGDKNIDDVIDEAYEYAIDRVIYG